MDTISEKAYQARAFPELSLLVDALDGFADELFAELGGDVLTIEFTDQVRYVINSHLAARQIWLAAERSAWHFDYDEARGQWIDRRPAQSFGRNCRSFSPESSRTPSRSSARPTPIETPRGELRRTRSGITAGCPARSRGPSARRARRADRSRPPRLRPRRAARAHSGTLLPRARRGDSFRAPLDSPTRAEPASSREVPAPADLYAAP